MDSYLNPVTGTVHASRKCAQRMAYGNVALVQDAPTCGLCSTAKVAAPKAARQLCTSCGEPTAHKSGTCSVCRDLAAMA